MRLIRLIVLAAAVSFGSTASASDVSPVVQRDEMVGGRSLVDWDVAWSRWIFGFRKSSLAQSEGCLPQSRPTPVRFLFTPLLADSHLTTINCTVPAGTYLLLGQPQVY